MARSSHEYDIGLLGRNYVFFFSYFSFFIEGFHYLKTTLVFPSPEVQELVYLELFYFPLLIVSCS